MSRKFGSQKNCGIVAVVSLLTFGLFSQSDAQELKLEMAPAPTIPYSLPSYAPNTAQTFQALIDDVIVEAPESADYYSTKIGCWLNGPADPINNAECKADCQPDCECDTCQTPLGVPPLDLEEAGEEADEWAALLTCPCTSWTCGGDQCGSSSLAITDKPGCGSSCSGCSDSSCPADLVTNPTATENEAFCKQVAKLLATTLNSSEVTPESRLRAIESAMKMVADNASAVSDSQTSTTTVQHELEIATLKHQLTQAKNQSKSIEQIKSYLGPIYENQNRNYEQMKLMNAAQFALNRTIMQRQSSESTPMSFSTFGPSTAPMAPDAITHSRYIPRTDNQAAELARLRTELASVNRRMAQLQSAPVQRASHLEPVYVPNRKLDPIYSQPKSNKPFNFRR